MQSERTELSEGEEASRAVLRINVTCAMDKAIIKTGYAYFREYNW